MTRAAAGEPGCGPGPGQVVYAPAWRTTAVDVAAAVAGAGSRRDMAATQKWAGRPRSPHVIGTMREIEDASAAEMAGTCYTALHAGQGAMDTSRAAQALHQAVRRARENLPGTPSLWACYLRVGA
jgi:hypothetical protein